MCLLVPVDISAPSRAAIHLSALLARRLDLSPLLLHVSTGEAPLAHLVDLYTLATPIHELGIESRLRTLAGDPAQVICQEAARRRARWIVMGTHLQGDPSKSVALDVMRRCTVPVIAVRPAPHVKLSAKDGFESPLQEIRRVGLVQRGDALPLARTLAGLLSPDVEEIAPEQASKGYDLVVCAIDGQWDPAAPCAALILGASCPVMLVASPACEV